MNVYVEEIQKGELEHFPLLLEQFKPLILCWLKRIHHLHTSEMEDYLSMAKIILLECAKSYNSKKNVPFQSYYKIKLYHWYGNQIQKRKLECITLEESLAMDHNQFIEEIVIQDAEKKERIQKVYACILKLNQQEKVIVKYLLQGLSAEEIAHLLHLSKKTILNRKYIIIKKIKEMLEEERQLLPTRKKTKHIKEKRSR